MRPIDRRLVRIYLSDHAAGAAGALARVERMAEVYAPTPLGEPLAGFAGQLAEEREWLLDVAERLVPPLSGWKSQAARLGELAARLKPNGRLRHASPLSALLELEILRGAVMGKRGLWETLARWNDDLGIDPERLAELDRRAEAQIALLGDLADLARDRIAAGADDVSDPVG